MQRHADPSSPPSPSTSRSPAVPIDRRGFLRSTAGGAAAVAVASLLPAGCSADYPQAEGDSVTLAALSPKEYAVVRAAAEALLDGVPVAPQDVASSIDRELAVVGEPIRSDMKNVLRLVEHFTILGLHRRTFTELRPEERLTYLQGWARSRLALRRAAFHALRGFVQYFAYVRPETRAITGFTGPFPETVNIPPVRVVDYGPVT